jgi:hypothetical protein
MQKSDMSARIDAIFRIKGEFDRGPESVQAAKISP